MALVGLVLGILYLLSFPAEAYASLAERKAAMEDRESLDPTPNDAFYIGGPVLRTRTWETKRRQIIDGSAQSVTVSIGEINAWLEANFRGGALPAGEESEGLTLIPETPNMGLSEDGTLYLNLNADIEGYGLDGDYVLSAQVRYGSGAAPGLIIDRMQIGAAVIPLPAVLGSRIVSAILGSYAESGEYQTMQEAWQRVQSVEVKEGALVLSLSAN